MCHNFFKCGKIAYKLVMLCLLLNLSVTSNKTTLKQLQSKVFLPEMFRK